MQLPAQFNHYIHEQKLFQHQDHLLLAVSGGVDSVVLCHLCKNAGYIFSIAHCNFQLRSADSDADEAFVKQLADHYNVPCYTTRFDTQQYADEKKISIQVAARQLRYNWFQSLMNPATQKSFTHLLTAHHANDNIETLLMNFFKGTGIAGLQGIPPISGKEQKLVRPLLFARKADLINYAKDYGLAFREDASNEENKYTRNYFRNELIPALQSVYPQVEENLLHNIARFKDVHTIYEEAITTIKKKLMVEKNGSRMLPVLKLQKTKALPTVLFELLKPFGFLPAQLTDIIKLLKAGSGKYVESATHRILKNREWLIVSVLHDHTQSYFLIEKPGDEIHFNKFIITIGEKDKPAAISTNSMEAQLDAKQIRFPLLLRRWKNGDYFYPLGMQKKKKLSRFFIDQKLSLLDKENVWVVESDKKIIWVAGHRIDDRFKVKPNSSSVYILKLRPAHPAP